VVLAICGTLRQLDDVGGEILQPKLHSLDTPILVVATWLVTLRRTKKEQTHNRFNKG